MIHVSNTSLQNIHFDNGKMSGNITDMAKSHYQKYASINNLILTLIFKFPLVIT